MQAAASMVETWLAQRRGGALARVIGADGLGPRPADELLLIDHNGRTGGALLGGAIEPEVVDAAQRMLEGATRHVDLSVQVDTPDAAAAGLTCGGAVNVLVQRLDAIPPVLWDVLAAGRPAALVTVLGADTASMVVFPDGRTVGTLGGSGLDTQAQAEAEPMLRHPGSSLGRVWIGSLELLIETWNPVPRVVIVGASAVAVAVTRQVELLGWVASTVVTSDAAVTTIDQLSPADVVLVIDHDPVVSTTSLSAALRRGVGYVGALGSRTTQARRREHLSDAGVRAVDIERLRGPAGLDIGSRTPAEAALSIVAEIIAVRAGRDGAALSGTTGKISG